MSLKRGKKARRAIERRVGVGERILVGGRRENLIGLTALIRQPIPIQGRGDEKPEVGPIKKCPKTGQRGKP